MAKFILFGPNYTIEEGRSENDSSMPEALPQQKENIAPGVAKKQTTCTARKRCPGPSSKARAEEPAESLPCKKRNVTFANNSQGTESTGTAEKPSTSRQMSSSSDEKFETPTQTPNASNDHTLTSLLSTSGGREDISQAQASQRTMSNSGHAENPSTSKRSLSESESSSDERDVAPSSREMSVISLKKYMLRQKNYIDEFNETMRKQLAVVTKMYNNLGEMYAHAVNTETAMNQLIAENESRKSTRSVKIQVDLKTKRRNASTQVHMGGVEKISQCPTPAKTTLFTQVPGQEHDESASNNSSRMDESVIIDLTD